MSDTTNTTTETATTPNLDTLRFNVAPPVDPQFDAVRELAAISNRLRASETAYAHVVAENARLASEQITDGADPRLEEFWDRAGRIADHADFCSEYDRMAEAMNGPRRERAWEVTYEVTVTIPVSVTVTARDEDAADDLARDEIDAGRISEAIEDAMSLDYNASYQHAERA